MHTKLSHPNVHRAFSEWSEDQQLYLACMYTNATRSKSRRYLFHDFRKRMESTPNVVLYVGEVAFGDRPFEVTSKDNPTDIQFRTADELWYKENVINLIVQRFPESANYIGYVDGDILMTRYDWALEAVHLLQHYKAVQLFSLFTDIDIKHRPLSITRGFAYSYAHHIIPDEYHYNIFGQQSPQTNKSVPIDNHGKTCEPQINNPHVLNISPVDVKSYGATDAYGLWGDDGQNPSYSPAKTSFWGATGLGWAFRKSTWQEINGLLDICILGSADWHMAYGMAGLANIYIHEDFSAGDPYVRAIQTWQKHAAELDANIWYTDNHIVHNWHGPKINRFYRERSKILVDNQFDPTTDLKRDWQGLYTLAGNKPKLRDDIRAYFRARNDDDPNLGAGQRPLV